MSQMFPEWMFSGICICCCCSPNAWINNITANFKQLNNTHMYAAPCTLHTKVHLLQNYYIWKIIKVFRIDAELLLTSMANEKLMETLKFHFLPFTLFLHTTETLTHWTCSMFINTALAVTLSVSWLMVFTSCELFHVKIFFRSVFHSFIAVIWTDWSWLQKKF